MSEFSDNLPEDAFNDGLDERLRGFYGAQELDTDALDHLKAIARGDLHQSPWWRRVGRPLLALAAAVLIGFGISMWWGYYTHTTFTRGVINEVALNHSKQLSVEVSETRWERLGERMAKLDFRPTRPEAIDLEANGYKLVGARYCSVRGQLAVQIRLVHETNEDVLTLYQFEAVDDHPRLMGEGLNQEVDGVKVVLWQENGLIMALARYGDDLG